MSEDGSLGHSYLLPLSVMVDPLETPFFIFWIMIRTAFTEVISFFPFRDFYLPRILLVGAFSVGRPVGREPFTNSLTALVESIRHGHPRRLNCSSSSVLCLLKTACFLKPSPLDLPLDFDMFFFPPE